MLRLQCDRCGRVFGVYHKRIVDKSGDLFEMNALSMGHYAFDNGIKYEYDNHADYNYELCPDCMNQFIAWMEDPKIIKITKDKEAHDAEDNED